MKPSVTLLVASRYFKTRRRERGNASSVLSVVGTAIGVMALTVVLAVMNGFQLGFIEPIVEISSYHLQIHPNASARLDASASDELRAGSALATRIRSLPSVTAVVPFVERQALVAGPFQKPRACVLRAVPPDLFKRDPAQAAMLAPREGSFDLASPGSVVIGVELAATLGVRVGDYLSLTSFAVGPDGKPTPQKANFRVVGAFRTGYWDFDTGLVFISLTTADSAFGLGNPLPRTYGVKIANRFMDAGVMNQIAPMLLGTGYGVESWRTYNKSFFDALFMEKLMMMVLVGLIFIVVGFNVYHSLRRSVHERMEEIAVLKAVGIPPGRIQAIFVLEGLIIGCTGAISGLLAGLAVAANINGVFSGVEAGINGLLSALRALSSPFFANEGIGFSFSLFSPAYFYISHVPSTVFPQEAFLVCFFAVLACTSAAWGASRAVSWFRPSEVLRYE
ncbi:MAG TPA: ABC transporter permease [Spirochaetia bacterium]|nr:ABC transporter permease [Spirochaetia bacterium]